MAPAILLALIAGYADTVGYLRFNAFAGLMTGNTIFLGVELAEQKWSAAANHFAIILMFLFGVALAQALQPGKLGMRRRQILQLLSCAAAPPLLRSTEPRATSTTNIRIDLTRFVSDLPLSE